jgi:hypothetical protein
MARLPVSIMPDDHGRAVWVVSRKEAGQLPLLQERFPVWAKKVEGWHVDDAPATLALIEQEVTDLVARTLGGGERQESQPTAAPIQERPAVKEPAKKPGSGEWCLDSGDAVPSWGNPCGAKTKGPRYYTLSRPLKKVGGRASVTGGAIHSR